MDELIQNVLIQLNLVDGFEGNYIAVPLDENRISIEYFLTGSQDFLVTINEKENTVDVTATDPELSVFGFKNVPINEISESLDFQFVSDLNSLENM